MTGHSRPPIGAIVVMGVSGAGKTTVGEALAAALGWRFADADDYHSPEAKAKMHAGHPLTDADRAPWLERVRAVVAAALGDRRPLVLACSALKHEYRAMLVPAGAPAGAVRFVHLDVARPELERRLAQRHHEFATPALLDSQLATLEAPSPAEAVIVDGGQPVDEIVRRVRDALHL